MTPRGVRCYSDSRANTSALVGKPMNVTLTVTAGPHAGRTFVFDRHDSFLVGRATDAHFRLSEDDPYFSRRHFLMEVNPPRVRVLDLNSRNGIVVNGAKVREADLADGDELRAGHTVFRLSAPPPPPETTSTPALDYLSATRTGQPPGETIEFAAGPSIPGYTLGHELGRGAMGVVYRATRESDGLAVALKLVNPAPNASRKDAERFLREARIMTALEHKHIVRCLDCGEIDAGLFLAMELVTGPDLRAMVADRGPLGVRMAVALAVHALNGLAHAHAKGYVHRDVKPANLLLDGPKEKKVARLADFGLARAYDTCNMSGLTMQGEIGGTPAFMAPEQVTHYREVKPAADQYAAAATLYFLLTAQYALNFEPTVAGQMIQIVTEERVPIRRRRPDVPAALEAVLQKALQREPNGRYQDVGALREALRPFA
jgi:eukaryotic-like serine/threonine-protein kinase